MALYLGNDQVSLLSGVPVVDAASQEELDAIAAKVGGITTPSTPASIETQADDLIEDANTATGEADETLTDAVGSLIAAMPSGSINVNANGTVNVAAFATALVNVPQAVTAVDVGTVTPYSSTRLRIPFNTSLTPAFYAAWSKDGATNNRACGSIGIANVFSNLSQSANVTLNFAVRRDNYNVLSVYGAQSLPFSQDNGYLEMDRAGTSGSYNSADVWNYMVFYTNGNIEWGSLE